MSAISKVCNHLQHFKFQTLEAALANSSVQKELIQKALKKDLAKTLVTIKKQHGLSHEKVDCILNAFKEAVQAKMLHEKDAGLISKITKCFEDIQIKNSHEKKLIANEVLSIAILSQHELPKIEAIRKRVFGKAKSPEQNWIPKKEFQLSHHLLLHPKKKAVYIIGKKLLAEGGFKKVLPSVGFTWDKTLGLKDLKLYAFAHTQPSKHGKKELKSEKALAKKVKAIPEALKAKYIEVAKTKKGSELQIVTKLCDGDLSQFIKKLTLQEKVVVAKDIVSSVQALHQKGYSHGDLKPGNFLIKSRRAKLTDFGASKPLHLANPCPLKSYGTFKYSAPETLSFQNSPQQNDQNADAFALGLTLWQLVKEEDLTKHWDKEVSHFSKVYYTSKSVPAPNMQVLDKIQGKIKTITEAALAQKALHAVSAQDKAMHSVLQIAAALLRPLHERMSVATAAGELTKLTVT